MNRNGFETLRDMPDKRIDVDVSFSKRANNRPIVTAEGIPVVTADNVDLKLHAHYNPDVGSKTVVAVVKGVGPICRLDVDGHVHRPVGRCHKHSLQTEGCPEVNLPDGVVKRNDLSGKTMREVFDEFCQAANITVNGVFHDPEE